jgi:hypothetical protein
MTCWLLQCNKRLRAGPGQRCRCRKWHTVTWPYAWCSGGGHGCTFSCHRCAGVHGPRHAGREDSGRNRDGTRAPVCLVGWGHQPFDQTITRNQSQRTGAAGSCHVALACSALCAYAAASPQHLGVNSHSHMHMHMHGGPRKAPPQSS